MTRPIALVGLMGAGKSSVARILGERLGVPAVDLDLELEAASGTPVARLFARDGEGAFRTAGPPALKRGRAAAPRCWPAGEAWCWTPRTAPCSSRAAGRCGS